MPNIKPGFKTSEFWLSLVAPAVTIVGSVAAADGYPINVPKAVAFVGAVVGTAVSSHGYAGSRSVVKKELLVAQSYLEQNLLYVDNRDSKTDTPPPPKPPADPPKSSLDIALGQLSDV